MLDVWSMELQVARLFAFTYPWAWNHCTASASACFGGVWGSPSSRIALAGLKNILYLAMRTPASGALGGLPVKNERLSSTRAAARATKYGIRTFGAGTPVISCSTPKAAFIVQFPLALPRM